MTRAFLFLLLFVAFCVDADAFCFEDAGKRYNVSPYLLWHIAKVESGMNPRAVNYNYVQDKKTGRERVASIDYGLMQVNSQHREKMPKEVWDRVRTDACWNVQAGAWVLAHCIHKYGYTWEAVGCYNAGTRKNEIQDARRDKYARKVYQAMLASWTRQ